MFEFRLPDLGEGIHEGELLKWHVKEGDPIAEDDPLCDMETDKAAVTIPSPRTGTIARLGAQPGDTVRVGAVLAAIACESTEGSAGESAGESAGGPGAEQPAIPEQPAGRSRQSGLKAIAAPATRRLAREMGIDVNRVLGTGPGGRVTREDLEAFAAAPEGEASVPDAKQDRPDSPGPEAPGSVNRDAAAAGTAIPFLEINSLPDFSRLGPVEAVPMRSLRRKVAVKTTSSAILLPHVAHMDEIDVTDLEALRRSYNRDRGPEGRLTLLAFMVKAVASLLKTYPQFNASVDHEKQEMILKKYYHIGFAADTPRGLMVPVIRDADRQTLAALGYRIRHLAEQAREDKIALEDLTGSTFSVTNVGAVGGTHVFPIINYPESAILGMGRVAEKPMVMRNADAVQGTAVARDAAAAREAIVIRSILPVTLCFDHRVADGAQAARFVGDLKEMLEDPALFMTRI